MYVCMYVCMHNICGYIRTYVCIYAHAYMCCHLQFTYFVRKNVAERNGENCKQPFILCTWY